MTEAQLPEKSKAQERADLPTSTLNQEVARADSVPFENAMTLYHELNEGVAERRTADITVQREGYRPRLKAVGAPAKAPTVSNFSISQKASSVGRAYLGTTGNALVRPSLKSQGAGNAKKKTAQTPQVLPQIPNQNEAL